MSTHEDRPGRTGAESGPERAEHGAGAQELEQVRRILFGSEVERNERRIERLEERLAREMAALRSDVKLRLDAVREEVSGELFNLSRAVSEEQIERARGQETLDKRIEEVAGSLDGRLDALRAEAERIHEDLNRTARVGVDALREEHRLRRTRDRKALAGLLTQVAARLTADEPQAD